MQELTVARCAVFKEFLVWDELSALMQYAVWRESDFRPSQVAKPEGANQSSQEYRRSRVLMDAGPFCKVMFDRIQFYFPRILQALGWPYFDIARIESQITASGNGDYFRLHNDNTQADIPSRQLTYVYFFHHEPKVFSGGELLIYDSRTENGNTVAAGVRRRISPQQNDIVFFPSSCLHEVLPVACQSWQFSDSRLTLNGWLH
jgi:Rps23 Pro-64 3,4-dihydroxylase Tpa1-like proline 4-hydroxylase